MEQASDSQRRIRLAIGAALVMLLVWLLVEPQTGVAARRNAVNDALRRGDIRPVVAAEMALVGPTVRWLAAAAGIEEPIVVNAPFPSRSDGRLHVFTTTPAAATVTHCERGNAVYDAELDTIFLDHDVIHSMDWDRALATTEIGMDSVPSLRVYLRFVILHELAHRVLHRTAAASFDIGGPTTDAVRQEMERAADRFAIRTMPKAYAIASRFGIEPVEAYTGETIQYPVTADMPVDDQVQASVVEMANIITLGVEWLSRGRSAFTPTRTHPSTVERARGLIAAAAAAPSSNAQLRALVAHTRLALESTHLAGTRIVDVPTGHIIGAITLDSDRLFATAVDTPHVRSFPLAFLRTKIGEAVRSTDGRVSPLEHPAQPRFTAVIAGRVVSFHYDLDHRIDHLDTVTDGSPRSRAAPLELIPSERPDQLFSPMGGGLWFVVQTPSVYHVLNATTLTLAQRIPRTDVTARATIAANIPVATLDLASGTFSGSTILVPLYPATQAEEEFVRIGELSLPTLAVRSVRSVRLPPGIVSLHGENTQHPQEHGTRAIAIVAGASPRVFLVDLVSIRVADDATIPARLDVWELDTVHAARRITSRPLRTPMLLRAFSIEELRNRWSDLIPRLNAVIPVPPSTLLVNVPGESVYAIDIDTGAIRVILHPGNGQLSFTTNGAGVAAITGQGWSRAYVLFRPGIEGTAVARHDSRETP